MRGRKTKEKKRKKRQMEKRGIESVLVFTSFPFNRLRCTFVSFVRFPHFHSSAVFRSSFAIPFFPIVILRSPSLYLRLHPGARRRAEQDEEGRAGLAEARVLYEREKLIG